MSDKKILFTDMDGTLLDHDKGISDNTRSALREMIGRGHRLALASGRPTKSIIDVWNSLDTGIDLASGGVYITAYNGAVLYDCGRQKTLERNCIGIDTAQRLFDMAAAEGLHIHTYLNDRVVSIDDDREIAYYTKYVRLPYDVASDLSVLEGINPPKLIVISLDDRERLEAFRCKVENMRWNEEFICAFSNKKYLEFYARRAGKGNALTNMCRILGIPLKDSVAAGDEENDISMIRAAGIGVAMQNANELLKREADYITENDNNHDGIAEIIERFVLGGK